MNVFPSFATQPQWDAQALAGAVPVRLRLHQLFAYDGARDGAARASANGDPAPRTPWRQHEYLRVAELPSRFIIH